MISTRMTSTRMTAQTIRLTTAALLATTLLATVLTGCTPADRALFNDKPVAARSSATPTPTPTPAAVGSTVDSVAAAKLNADDGDSHAYQLANGSFVIVNTKQPLPAVVTADIAATAVPIFAPYKNPNLTPADRPLVQAAVVAYVYKTFTAIGKTPIIFVFTGITESTSHIKSLVYVTFSSYGGTGIKAGTHAVVLAAAQVWAAQNGARLFDLG